MRGGDSTKPSKTKQNDPAKSEEAATKNNGVPVSKFMQVSLINGIQKDLPQDFLIPVLYDFFLRQVRPEVVRVRILGK